MFLAAIDLPLTPPVLDAEVDPAVRELLRACLALDPEARPKVKAIAAVLRA